MRPTATGIQAPIKPQIPDLTLRVAISIEIWFSRSNITPSFFSNRLREVNTNDSWYFQPSLDGSKLSLEVIVYYLLFKMLGKRCNAEEVPASVMYHKQPSEYSNRVLPIKGTALV